MRSQSRLIPIEIELSATPRPEMAKEIASFRRDSGDHAAGGYVVHPGKMALPLGSGVIALPFAEL